MRDFVKRSRRHYAGWRAKQILEGPLRRSGENAQGWTAKRVEGGYILQPSIPGVSFAVTWEAPRNYDFEVHGQAFVLLDNAKVRVGEVRLDADGPVKLFHSPPERLLEVGARVTLEASASVVARLQIADGMIIDRGVSDPHASWRVWKGERSLTYLLDEPTSKEGRAKLCVVFSAIGAPWDFTYNYRSSLAEVDAYRLYILDNFGAQGSYYFADHRDTSIFKAVQSFLLEMAEGLGIRPVDITLIGSSKGGTAALAHGLKLGVGRILAGAPQFLPGSYLRGAGPGILSFIAGDDSPASVAWLDKMIPESIGDSVAQTRIMVLVGANDSHLQIHVQPLMKMAEGAGLDAKALVVDDLSHQNIGRAFAPYVGAALRVNEGSDLTALLPYVFEWRGTASKNEVQLKLWVPRGETVSVEFRTEEGVLSFFEAQSATYYKTLVPSGTSVWAIVSRIGVDGAECGTFETYALESEGRQTPSS